MQSVIPYGRQHVTEDDIRSVRPGYGLPPKYYNKLLGSSVLKAVKPNTPVTFETVKLSY